MSESPNGWTEFVLGDLAEYHNGAAFRPADWGRAGIPIIRIQNLTDPSKPLNRTTRKVDERLRVRRGDILVSWSATLDTFIWDGEEAWLNQHIFRVVPREQVVDKKLLFLLLRRAIGALLETEHLHGSTMKHINRAPFLAHVVRLPPLHEQRRIVAKLDGLLARSKSAREELALLPRLMSRYKQAVLAAAFKGEPKDGETDAWPIVNLGDFITSINAGKNMKCEERPPRHDERGIVKVSSVTWGEFDPFASKTPSASSVLDERAIIQPGDFLISRANTLELVGACVIVRAFKPTNLYLSDKILRLRFTEPLERWVLHFLRSAEGRKQIEALSTGNQLSMRNISQNAIRAIKLPLPPAETRDRILDKIEKALNLISTVADQATRASVLLNRLDQATLAKAFRGELVPPGE